MSFCGADVDGGANAEASEASGAGISVLGNLHISIWINGTSFIRPIAGLNGYTISSISSPPPTFTFNYQRGDIPTRNSLHLQAK